MDNTRDLEAQSRICLDAFHKFLDMLTAGLDEIIYQQTCQQKEIRYIANIVQRVDKRVNKIDTSEDPE